MINIWDITHIQEGKSKLWTIGPLSLLIESKYREWGFHWDYEDDAVSDKLSLCDDCNRNRNFKFEERIGFTKSSDTIQFIPTLPDIPIVIRPELPFVIPPKEEVTMFMSVPLWIKVQSGGTTLQEIPSVSLSETWLGDSTISGEICYASKTSAKLVFEHILKRPYRAICALQIKNHSDKEFPFVRIKIPVQNLSLFKDEQNLFYTETIMLTREKNGTDAKVNLTKSPHHEFGKPHKFSGPRHHFDEGLMAKAITSFFGKEL